jgi:hypothetical protein
MVHDAAVSIRKSTKAENVRGGVNVVINNYVWFTCGVSVPGVDLDVVEAWYGLWLHCW